MTADQIVQLAHQLQPLMVVVPIVFGIVVCVKALCWQSDRQSKRSAREAERDHIERMNRK